MPATEQTWRNPKLLHIVFGVSSLIMLVSTIWMFTKDHTREWKDYQKATNAVNQFYTVGREVEAKSVQFAKDLTLAEASLAEAETLPSRREDVAEFKKLVEAESKRLEIGPVDFTDVDKTLETTSGSLEERRSELIEQRKLTIEHLKALLAESQGRKDQFQKKMISASEGESQQAPQNIKDEYEKQKEELAALTAHVQKLDRRIQSLNKELDSFQSLSADFIEFEKIVIADADRRKATPIDLSKVAQIIEGSDGEAIPGGKKRRDAIVSDLMKAVADAKYREDTLLQERKFAAANLTATLSLRDLAVTEGRPQEIIDQRQAVVDKAREKVEDLSTKYEAASLNRRQLESVLKRITAPVDNAQANLVKVKADVKRYQDSVEGFSKKLGRTLLGMPILDAFDNSDLAIDQIWLPTLTINYNFSSVARFDRCITCHRSNESSQPGAPTEPAYVHEEPPRILTLTTPEAMPVRAKKSAEEKKADEVDGGNALSDDQWVMREAYGLLLANEGLIDPNDVTVQVVWPKVGEAPARAAEAGLQMGDVIEAIDGTPVLDRNSAAARLVGEVDWGKPIQLTVRRGLPHPFASHPRLDLFCGSTSPHQQGAMGCTICHDGQGSATEFKWASHTPNNPTIGENWRGEHGWFDNHHWIFPMYPKRFVESGCLKCHHEVVELEPSESFPEPPAPKLIAGYELVRQYGCFGCHEINGFDGPDKRIGPDMRAEPNFYAVAQALLLEPSLTLEERGWAEELVHHPERNDARHRLSEAIQLDKKLRAKDAESAVVKVEEEKEDTEGEKLAARFSSTTYRLGDQLKDVESPGTYRKPGPSLRYVASKNDFDFLYDWIRNPFDFRPSTKMPRFFGLWDHLSKDEQKHTAPLEAIEIRAISKYLLDSSQPFEYATPLEGITEQASVARGAHLFQTRGCLACHSHADFPGINNNQGPDLTLLAAKLGTEKGTKWLYSWLRDPASYHVRTKMPNMLLEPVQSADGKVSDPIADITAFLTTTGVGLDVSVSEDGAVITKVLSGGVAATNGQIKVEDTLVSIGEGSEGEPVSVEGKSADDLLALLRGPAGSKVRIVVKPPEGEESSPIELTRAGYQPEHLKHAKLTSEEETRKLTPEEEETLKSLALENLKKAYPLPTAKRYLEDGILDIDPNTMKGDDVVLAGEINDSNRTDKLMLYVGRRAISKYGCSGCHDIPAYEDAKPIGTGLADWGRKDPSRLAFEQISQFLPLHGGGHAAAHAAHGGEREPYNLTPEEVEDPNTLFYFEAISQHNRQGFIWQKLRQPRSYDYEKVSNKDYNDRLRMPQFPFDAKEREEVITFILGLVAEPPAAKYIYDPNPRQEAIVKGRRVLEAFNCSGCHTLNMSRWEFAFEPGDENYVAPPPAGGYPFLAAHATAEQVTKSIKIDREGMRKASVMGRPAVSETTGNPLLYNEDLDPIEPGEEAEAKELYYSFELWDNAVINGHMFQAGGPALLIKDSAAKKYPALGGDLANYLFPLVIADEKQRNPQVKGIEAWGWLPPPLVGEGKKVQSAWLHDFLLDPTPIRPAVVLRMPKFNMSPDDASALANYFAAVDNAEYPYEFDSRTASANIQAQEISKPGRLKDALGIVVNNTYCVKCHKVGDFAPGGSEKAMGPNLAEVYHRLRPEYTRRWVADPKRILPYTGMPVNIPYLPAPPHYGGIAQDIFPGTSFDQLDGLVDLLMNYDLFTKQEVSIKPLVKAPPAEGETPPAGEEKPVEKKEEAADESSDSPPSTAEAN